MFHEIHVWVFVLPFTIFTELKYDILCLNPVALRMVKTLWSFGHSECSVTTFLRMTFHCYDIWSTTIFGCCNFR